MNGSKSIGNPGDDSAAPTPAPAPASGPPKPESKELPSPVKDTSKTDDEPESGQRSDRMYIDLGCGITHMLTEGRFFRRNGNWQDRDHLEPSAAYARFLLPPSELMDMPETGLCSRYLHTSINRIRHPVTSLVWSPEGRRVITGSQNGEFTLWSSFGFISDSSISGHDSAVRTMAWTKNTNWLASGDQDGNLKIWTPQLRPVTTVKAHNNALRGLSFAPTDLKLCSGSDDLKIKIWDFPSAKEETILSGHGFDVKSVAWHPTKSLILSGGRDNVCKLWNPKSGKELASITGHKNTVSCVRWNPHNGNWFVSTSRDKTIRVYDLRMIKKASPCLHVLEAHSSEVYSAAWHPVFEQVLATGGYDGSLLFWTIAGKRNKPVVQSAVPAAHEGAIWTMDWHPAGHLLSTGSNDRTCKFWSRMLPGADEDELYRGYLRDVSELDVLKSMHREPPPVPQIDYQKEQQMQRQVQNRKRNISRLVCQREQDHHAAEERAAMVEDLAKTDIPSVGTVGEDLAKRQAGLVLTPPTIAVTKRVRYNPDPAKVTQTMMGSTVADFQQSSRDRKKKPRENISSSAHSELGGGGHHRDRDRDRGSRGGDYGGGGGSRQRATVDPTKLPGPRKTGLVRMFDSNKGYGFIRPHDGTPDLFAHSSDIETGFGLNGEQKLEKGVIVVFRVEKGANKTTGKEQYKARNIVLIDHDPEMAKRIPSTAAPVASAPPPRSMNMPPPVLAPMPVQQPSGGIPRIAPALLQTLIQQANDPIQLTRTLAMHNLSVEELQMAIQQQHMQPQGQMQPPPMGDQPPPAQHLHSSYNQGR